MPQCPIAGDATGSLRLISGTDSFIEFNDVHEHLSDVDGFVHHCHLVLYYFTLFTPFTMFVFKLRIFFSVTLCD